MEIGSIYEINPAWAEGEESGISQDPCLGETAKYGKRYCSYTASGREAIALALKSLERNRPGIRKKCLLPAYMCDTVFFPFRRAGWEIYFYHINIELAASEEELCSLMGQVRPGLLFVHPYYGVDTWKPMRPLLLEWKRQGICIMEDVTQSYYLEGAGKEADYVIGSLRKWYPVPDGGFVAAEEKLYEEETEGAEEFAGLRLAVLTEKWRYLYGQEKPEKRRERKERYLRRNRELEEELDRFAGIRRLSPQAMRILQETDEAGARERRNANYRYLYKKLWGNTQFEPMLKVYPLPMEEGKGPAGGEADGNQTAPLYFALYVKERDELQCFLREHDIYAPVLWPIGAENGNCLSPEERDIYAHMLALPVDQRYGKEEMQRMADVMGEYESRKVVREKPPESVREVTVPAELRNGDFEQIVGIRADANETVAMGHIMRCITIAKELVRKGSRVIFFTADEYACHWLEREGMEMVCLHSRWDDMESEIPLLRKELARTGCGKLVVDSYKASAEYLVQLKDLCKLIYIDDCFAEIYPVDLLINYNAYHVRFPYSQVYGEETELLLGTCYVPLREEFRSGEIRQGRENTETEEHFPQGRENTEIEEHFPQGRENTEIEEHFPQGSGNTETGKGLPHILLSSGGGDAYDALTGILNEAVKDGELCHAVFHVVVGRFHNGRERLEQLAAAYPGIRLHREVTNMAELMAACDGAASAAGTMLFELSAMAVPTVFFVSADNQQYDSEFFAAEDRMLFAGDVRTDRQGCMERICAGLKRILRDGELRRHMKKALRRVADGRGAERIAEAVLRL